MSCGVCHCDKVVHSVPSLATASSRAADRLRYGHAAGGAAPGGAVLHQLSHHSLCRQAEARRRGALLATRLPRSSMLACLRANLLRPLLKRTLAAAVQSSLHSAA